MEPSDRIAQVIRLHSLGYGCRATAAAIGCSPSTVSAIAKAEGLTYPSAQTRAATAASADAARAQAAETAQQIADTVQATLGRMHLPVTTHYATPDGLESVTDDLPNAADTRAYAATVENLLRGIERLRSISGPDRNDTANSIVRQLTDGLAAIVEADRAATGGNKHEHPDEPDAAPNVQ